MSRIIMGLVHRKILLRTLSEMEVIKSTPTQPVPLRRPCPGGDARPRYRPRLIGRRMFYFRIETKNFIPGLPLLLQT